MTLACCTTACRRHRQWCACVPKRPFCGLHWRTRTGIHVYLTSCTLYCRARHVILWYLFNLHTWLLWRSLHESVKFLTSYNVMALYTNTSCVVVVVVTAFFNVHPLQKAIFYNKLTIVTCSFFCSQLQAYCVRIKSRTNQLTQSDCTSPILNACKTSKYFIFNANLEFCALISIFQTVWNI